MTSLVKSKMKTNRKFSLYYDRRGSKQSPSVIKGLHMNKNDLVVGRVEPIHHSTGSHIKKYMKDITMRKTEDSFLMWLEEYKDKLCRQLETAIEKKNSDKEMFILGKILSCNDIELAYLKLK